MNNSKIRQKIFALGWPATLEMGFQTLLGATDLIFVSHLGAPATGAVGVINTMMTLLLLSFGTLGSGGAVLVAQYFGKNEHGRVSAYAGQIFFLGILVSVLVATGIVNNADTLLLRFGADVETAATGAIYLSIVGGALPAALLSVLGGEVLRAVGESRIPFVITSTSLFLNTILNAILVFGLGPIPSLGVAGAAFATAFTRIIAVVVLAWYIFSHPKPLKFRIVDIFHFNFHLIADIFRLAWPVTIGESVWSTCSFLYVLMYTTLGQQVLAASQIISTLHNFIVMLGFGLGIAGLALVGQALGAEQIDDAYHTANQVLLMTVWVSVAGAMLIVIFLPLIHLLYPNIDRSAQELIKLGLIVLALITPFCMLNMVFCIGILRGGGDTHFVLIIDVITAALIGIPIAYLLGIVLKFGFMGVILGRVAEEVLRVLLFYKRFLSQRWARIL